MKMKNVKGIEKVWEHEYESVLETVLDSLWSEYDKTMESIMFNTLSTDSKKSYAMTKALVHANSILEMTVEEFNEKFDGEYDYYLKYEEEAPKPLIQYHIMSGDDSFITGSLADIEEAHRRALLKIVGEMVTNNISDGDYTKAKENAEDLAFLADCPSEELIRYTEDNSKELDLEVKVV